MRIIQISDTHLSVEHAHFTRNTDIIANAVAELAPDLIVHTGDASMDGAGQVRDLELAARWNKALPAEVLVVPGNHDVGDLPTIKASQPVDNARLNAWRSIVGADRWSRDVGDWRLIGLNAMLFATGLPDEDAQVEWLASVLSTTRPIALFLHKPLCIETPTEGPRGYWTVLPGPRARVMKLLAAAPVRLISSGHLHIHRERRIAGVPHVWSPAASFVVGHSQEDLGGQRRLGLLEHTFSGDHVTTRFIRPEGLDDLLIEPVQHIIYPPTDTAAM